MRAASGLAFAAHRPMMRGAAKGEPAPKGPERRFVVSKLVIRDITAHVEWNALVAKESALDVKIEGVELENPGGSRGLTLAEL